MKKKFLLLATTLLVSSVCLYGCGEDKNKNDTVVEQTEVVEVQNQAEDEDVVSTGDNASKNYEYNHVFDDIINEAPIIDTDFLQMTSNEQVMAKYGETGYGSSEEKIKYYINEEDFLIIEIHEDSKEMNEYMLSSVKDAYFTEQKDSIISDSFNSDLYDYLSIEGETFKGIGYPKGSDDKRLVIGHTYSELVEAFGSKGSLLALDSNRVIVAWCYSNLNNSSGVTYLSFDPASQECIEVGY